MKRITFRSPLVWIPALVVLVIAAIAGFLLLHRGEPEPVAAAPAPDVAVVPVARRDLAKTLTVVAELRPWNVVDLYAKQSGYLRDIYVDYGSRVTAGATIGTLELPEQEAAYQQAQAAYVFAKSEYDRVLAVAHAEPGLLAAVDIDKSRAQYFEARDARDQDAVLLGYASITAPFSGVITKRYADPGSLIQAGTSTGTKPVVQISDLYTLRLVVEVPEQNVQQIHVGTPVDVTMQSTGKVVRGRVSRFSYDVHEDTRTMHTEIDIPNPSLALKPGMYASATFVLDRRNGVLAVPPQTIVTSGDASRVWLVDGKDELVTRDVRVGLQTADWVEITGGLSAGERVVFGNLASLAVGERVHPRIADRPAS
jgi:RND family efflux transporter MFP subunit